jgi:hypothetical protein
MARPLDHPNEPGKWTCLEAAEGCALWRRERSDPFPVTLFYLVAPPRQTELIYGEAEARTRYERLAPVRTGDADQAA